MTKETTYYYYRVAYEIYEQIQDSNEIFLVGFNTLRLVNSESMMTPLAHQKFELELQSFVVNLINIFRKADNEDAELYFFQPNQQVRLVSFEEVGQSTELHTDYVQIQNAKQIDN